MRRLARVLRCTLRCPMLRAGRLSRTAVSTAVAVLGTVVFLVGCNQTSPLTPNDPFFGSTRVPPPRTGMLPKKPAADPYYSSRRDSVNPVRSGSPVVASTSGAIGSRYEPPGGRFDYREKQAKTGASTVSSTRTWRSGDHISIPAAARRESTLLASKKRAPTTSEKKQPEVASKPKTLTSGGLARGGTVEQTLGPRPGSAVTPVRGRSIWPVPKAVDSRTGWGGRSTEVIDIMDLPPVGASGSSKFKFVDPNVRQASATEDASAAGSDTHSASSKVNGAGASAARLHYGYDPKYAWLRGKLEYSQREGRWKLRYIPIDGETDDYGGSVVLADISRLSGCERGDFVEVHGQVAPKTEDEEGFAPKYTVSRVVHLD